MKLFNFGNKGLTDIEEELVEDIINEKRKEQNDVTAIVVQYIQQGSDDAVAKIVTDFHNDIMPSINSIIWARDKEQHKMKPYKVIRFDFFETNNPSEYKRLFIVVVPAKPEDILETYEY